ncbi:anti-sigma-F factor Fin [Barrientosiimonas marina]|uniref:Anti-sigma-F factor Fin n=1 Tax=Lentibacillus kimchii TaxID=1542911 RepID=A0ABW2UTZ3_9BACI
MAIIYECRHCSREIGRVDEQMTDDTMLGLDQLSSEEKRDMLSYEADGSMRITVICEHCEASLSRHPHYHELDYFIQ